MKLKQFLFSIIAGCMALATMAACQSNNQSNEQMKETAKKSLVAYFSATGTTKAAAQKLAAAAGADIFEIAPETPYTAADLDWKDKQSRSSVVMSDKSSRPAISGMVENMAQYDTVYVGFPIWWYIAPTIVNTFVEQYDLSGKTVIPFFTSGGSEAGETLKYLTPSAPNAHWLEPKNMNGMEADAIQAWVGSLRM